MIKRIVGLLAAVAVLAVVVFAILGSGTYSSFIGRDGPADRPRHPPRPPLRHPIRRPTAS